MYGVVPVYDPRTLNSAAESDEAAVVALLSTSDGGSEPMCAHDVSRNAVQVSEEKRFMQSERSGVSVPEASHVVTHYRALVASTSLGSWIVMRIVRRLLARTSACSKNIRVALRSISSGEEKDKRTVSPLSIG